MCNKYCSVIRYGSAVSQRVTNRCEPNTEYSLRINTYYNGVLVVKYNNGPFLFVILLREWSQKFMLTPSTYYV